MNSARQAKKNSLALKIMTLFTVVKLIVFIINHKKQEGMLPLIIIFVLYGVGNILFYIKDNSNSLFKYTAISGFATIVCINTIATHELIDILPVFVAMGMCFVYMDSLHTIITCGVSAIGTLVGTIISISDIGFAASVSWIEIFLLSIIFTLAIRMASDIINREQSTDKQEIEYHVAYQEEITANMVKVVDAGNAHIEQLQVKLDEFRNATTEVTRSVDAISRGITETADNMETSTMMTQQIQDIIDNLIDVKDHTIGSTQRAIESVETGQEIIESLKEKSWDINVANENVTTVSADLLEKILSAEEITQIIYQISTQTNLLALNASIEAARAGEQGRGFAVVADEIRKLADDTRSSIDNITELLRGITELANNTSLLIKKSVDAVEEQARYIEAADTAFNTIAEVVDELHQDMEVLDSISGNLDESNNSIIDGLANQQAASEEIAANAQSSADLCECNLDELEEVIDELNEVAKIIGSLKNGDLDEINEVLSEVKVDLGENEVDRTDYSSYFDDGDEEGGYEPEAADESEEYFEDEPEGYGEEEYPEEEYSEEEYAESEPEEYGEEEYSEEEYSEEEYSEEEYAESEPEEYGEEEYSEEEYDGEDSEE